VLARALDWLQRLQAGWSAIPESAKQWLRGLVGAAVVAVGGAVTTRMSNWTAADAYLFSVVVGSVALVAYGLFLRLKTAGNEVEMSPDDDDDDDDRNAPKQFSPKNAVELFDLVDSIPNDRARNAALRPHIGLWLRVSGIATEIEDEPEEERATVTVDVSGVDTSPRRAPRPVRMWFQGDDAAVVHAMTEGDAIEAIGRIYQIHGHGMFQSIMLTPCELLKPGRTPN
jgi:hypothetical protein